MGQPAKVADGIADAGHLEHREHPERGHGCDRGDAETAEERGHPVRREAAGSVAEREEAEQQHRRLDADQLSDEWTRDRRLAQRAQRCVAERDLAAMMGTSHLQTHNTGGPRPETVTRASAARTARSCSSPG